MVRPKKDAPPVVRLPVPRSTRSKRKADNSPADLLEETTSNASKSSRASKKTKQVDKNDGEERIGMTEEELYGVFKNSEMPESEKPTNVLKCLDLLQYGPKRDRCFYLKSISDNFVQKSIKQLGAADYAGRFTRRITALAWHQRCPHLLASASKFGDIMFISGTPNDRASSPDDPPLTFTTKAEIQGAGAGASVIAMKFHDVNPHLLYRSSIDCTVVSVDLVRGTTKNFHDTGDYNRWFCSLDVNFPQSLVFAGDSKSTAYKFSTDGKLLDTIRLHTSKIHHCEFSKKSKSFGMEEGVKIWDIRFVKSGLKTITPSALHTLQHNSAMNCARFSPQDGSRLLTSDQNEEIRVYQGPLWKDYITITHHHKQFQHITPIKADWHRINDYIVIGRYPKDRKSQPTQNTPRAIEFFDSYSGKLVDAIYPPVDEICSLNVFNPTGEYLATGMNSKLILWRPTLAGDYNSADAALSNKKAGSKSSISQAARNVLRGRSTREFSPVSDDDEEEEDTTAKKKKARAKTTSTSSTGQSKTSGKSSASKKKK